MATDRARPAPFASEALEPFAARVIGLAASQYVAAKAQTDPDPWDVRDGLCHLWWAVCGLNKISLALRGGRSTDDASGLHFSLAVSNEVGRIRRMILEELGFDPYKQPGFKEA